MLGNDYERIRAKVRKEFIATLREGDRAGTVGFNNSARTYHALSDKLEAVSASLDKIYALGGTNIGAGVGASLRQFYRLWIIA